MIYELLVQVFLLVLFILMSLVVFTLPGLWLLKLLKVQENGIFESYTISTVLGIVSFTLSAFVLAILNLRFLMWLFPIAGLISVFFLKKIILGLRFHISKKSLIYFSLILIIGVVGQVAVNAPSGFRYSEGLNFWSAHGRDGMWHLSLMEELHKNIYPFQNPIFAGHKLQNYHFFVDLTMSEITRLFPFNNLDIYFRLVPILFSLLIGLSSFIFVKLWSNSERAGLWAMVFTYFAGSFGYILLYLKEGRIMGGESIFWGSQVQSVLGNPPQAIALIILIVFMYSLLKYLISRNKHYLVILLLLGGTIIEFKVYGGILILGGLAFIALYEVLHKRFEFTVLLFLTCLLSLGIYLPNSSNSQSFLVYEPWWFIRTMVVSPDKLDWLDLELRRQTYLAESNWKRVIQLELMAFLIFLFGNLGMRFLGFMSIFKLFKGDENIRVLNIFFSAVLIVAFIFPLIYLQKGVAYNTIQFQQYYLLLFGFLAALTMDSLLKKINNFSFRTGITFLVILLSIPTQLGLLWQFYSNQPLARISNQEISALNFLKNNLNDSDIVLTAPFNKYDRDKIKGQPSPIYIWGDTGYVSALSGKRTFLSDYEQIDILGYEYKELLKEQQDVFEIKNKDNLANFLGKHNITYIYLPGIKKNMLDGINNGLENIFENEEVIIYKVVSI